MDDNVLLYTIVPQELHHSISVEAKCFIHLAQLYKMTWSHISSGDSYSAILLLWNDTHNSDELFTETDWVAKYVPTPPSEKADIDCVATGPPKNISSPTERSQ